MAVGGAPGDDWIRKPVESADFANAVHDGSMGSAIDASAKPKADDDGEGERARGKARGQQPAAGARRPDGVGGVADGGSTIPGGKGWLP